MKIKLFTIPNILTLGNLLCGVLSLLAVVVWGDLLSASLLLAASALFDFCDGFAARLLNQSSPIGRELDSLADMVSFGLVPSIIMMTLFELSAKSCGCDMWIEMGGYLSLLIVLFSALRLAKFNIDESQSCCFEGLPTPACALLCVSMALLYHCGYRVTGEVITAISVVSSWLLISPIRMFSFKLKGLAWRDNKNQYIFIASSIVASALILLFANGVFILPTIMVLYIIISTISHLSCNKCS
ncbi:MAG: CDP-diacylglycerol--serine O-phosphatidyltransferase [Rikenellaceae bacterium]